MKQLLLITNDSALRAIFAQSCAALGATLSATASWADARDKLFKNRYDALFIDYEAMKIEGLDAFILLDNVLQKEQTPGVLLLRRESARARQFLESLGSFSSAVQLAGAAPSEALLRAPIERALREGEHPPEAPGATQDADVPVRVQVHLSTNPAGTLAEIDLARALYTIALTEASGYLALSNGALNHRYAFCKGQLKSTPDARLASADTLAGAFAWTEGRFEFRPAQIDEGRTVEPLQFIYQGLHRHRSARVTMRALMPKMRTYPTPTDLWENRREALAGLGLLGRLMQACDGVTTLERAITSLGPEATDGFQAAFFATQTDLLILRDEPTPQGIAVEYNREVVRIQQQQVDAQRKSTKAWRAAGTDRVNLERELADFLAKLERVSPYEVFGVWEGCGREVVQKKFYELVKAHHPDVYGGNISGDVKRLAQEIFIAIKDSYQELLKVERAQTRPRPGSNQRSANSGRPTSQAGVGDEPSFAARPASSNQHHQPRRQTIPGVSKSRPQDPVFNAAQSSQARQSRVDRLRTKRSATPIGLGREPSSGSLGSGSSGRDAAMPPSGQTAPRSRRNTTPLGRRATASGRDASTEASDAARQAKIAKIRSRSTPGLSGNTGSLNAEDTAQRAFNEGYSAWRENENIQLASDRFATAYNLQPNNAKYMTFYGYFLFLRDASLREDARRILEKAIEFKDRQSLPDAYLFMGHLLKNEGREQDAVRCYRRALKLNPMSRDAQREIRLYEKRNKGIDKTEGSGFFKNLFKK